MNEQIVWYAPIQNPETIRIDEYITIIERERLVIGRALGEIGLETTISEDLEDLRLTLSRIEPKLLLAELCEVELWQGWDLISSIRDQGTVLPVMVISGEQSGERAVAAFKAGGNEYMSKPLHIGEFKSRIQNLLTLTGRRRNLSNLLKIDGLLLDPSRRLVSREGIELKMTPKEFDLLYYLAANLGIVCPRSEILSQVWGYHFQADTNVVDVYIRHIRKKVDQGHRNKLIHTVRGTGYVMRVPEGGTTS